MDSITRKEYWQEVEDLAKQIAAECREHGQERSDILHETIDGHEWIIYNRHHTAVLAHCSNENAIFDEMGRDAMHGVDGSSEVLLRMAFWAFMQDVGEALSDIPEDADEDEDAEPASAEGGAS